MLGFLYFILAIILILMAVRLLPLAFLATGYFWLWNSHRWVLIVALLLGAIIGVWKALHNRDEPAVYSPPSTALSTRHGLRRRIRGAARV